MHSDVMVDHSEKNKTLETFIEKEAKAARKLEHGE